MNNKQLIDDSEPLTQSDMAEQVFNMWVENTISGGIDRFFSDSREEYMVNLINGFIEFNINYNTALTFDRKIVKALVSKEGLKNQGKYKGWAEKVMAEFKKLLLEVYSDKGLPIKMEEDDSFTTTSNDTISIPSAFETSPTYGDNQHLSHKEIISAWAKNRFSLFYNSQIDLLSHRIGHELNTMFQKEVLKSSWITSRKDIPEWAIDIVQK